MIREHIHRMIYVLRSFNVITEGNILSVLVVVISGMTILLYQEDSYLREFDALVIEVNEDRVILDKTAFHPRPSGGLGADTGVLVGSDGASYRVIDTLFDEEKRVLHVVDKPGLEPGDRVHGVIDWERRYKMMKLHTASHVLAAVLYKRYGALVTGGHIEPDIAKDDFDLSMVQDWKSAFREAVEETNRILSECHQVKVYWLPREEALKIPGLVKLAGKLPPSVDRLRIVEIPGIDIQADGGPHVKNTCEVPGIEIVKLESKGRRRRRIYYKLRE